MTVTTTSVQLISRHHASGFTVLVIHDAKQALVNGSNGASSRTAEPYVKD